MRFLTLLPLAVVALLPFTEAIILLETTAATAATTYGITVGGGAAAAAGVAAVAVAGALVLGGLALAAASNRGKRDVGAQCLPANSPDLFITLAANSDRFGCGLRLVCELEATPDDLLSQDEKLILSLFGRHVKPATFSQLNTPKSGFLYAAFVGSNAKNVSECAEVFDQCIFDRETIMKAFNAQK
ncbi:uncharacterized protein LOC122247610 [Penaeus japonicus]|uniref:uncharacterized protein LOC122247610 n=1 Tax=Penaeus japonicus TaxID=27405 RepID=UPI001C7111E4|nr:uncharacterized protein LOC122247610 [Penaeus japonicus]